MRALVVAAIVALLTVPAYSQGMMGGKRQGHDQKAEGPKKKPDDKEYGSALTRIPERKYDPWKAMRRDGGTGAGK